MAEERPVDSGDWPRNYFNYFTEIEERFREARGSGLFLLSPLDWALIETWKDLGVPLEAVLRGIDAAFVKWRGRKQRSQMVNSLAYCAQAVTKEAEILAGAAPAAVGNTAAPFSLDELGDYLQSNANHLLHRGEPQLQEIGASLRELAESAESHYSDLEALEQRLSALEERMLAVARANQPEEQLLSARRALDFQLKAYRGKMTAPQLAMLERQFLDRYIIETKGLRRLSLFYLGS